MSEQIKRWNIPRGTTVSESPNGTWVDREDFDTLAQRLQEAERLLGEALDAAEKNERHRNLAETRYWCDQYKLIARTARAFLAGKGGKP